MREAPDWKKYYAYPEDPPSSVIITHLRSTRRHEVKKAVLQYGRDHDGTADLRLILFERPGAEKNPTILVNPIFQGVRLGKFFARSFVRRGFNAVVIMHPPFRYNFDGDYSQVEDYLRHAVIRNLKTLDWISAYGGTDPERIATFGASFGAVIGCAVAALDARPKCHVIALAGGPLAEIIAGTRNRRIRRMVRREARRQEISPRELGFDLLAHIKTDPLALARHVKPDTVAMCMGLFDRVIRPRYTRSLWKAMGRPRMLYVPFGHYSTIVSWPLLQRMACRFFREKLAC